MIVTVDIDVSAFSASLAVAESALTELAGDVLYDVAIDASSAIAEAWPRRTGLSAESFRVSRITGGARLDNSVPYVPHVHERGGRDLALDAIVGPAIEGATSDIPDRVAAEAARRIR